MTSDADELLSWVGEQEMKGWEAERPSVGLSAYTRTYPPKDPRTILAQIVRELVEATEHADEECQYGDGCPQVKVRHGACYPCRMRRLLSRAAAHLPKEGE